MAFLKGEVEKHGKTVMDTQGCFFKIYIDVVTVFVFVMPS